MAHNKHGLVQIATGATARVPDTPGLRDVGYLTNETIWNLTEMPRRLLVWGCGPIGASLPLSAERPCLLHDTDSGAVCEQNVRSCSA